MNMLIALVGAKGAGKTTAFNIIQEILQAEEITLAKKLKDVCSEVFEISRKDFDSHSRKEKDLEDPVFLTKEKLISIFQKYDLFPEYDKYIRGHIGKILFTPRQVAQYIGTEVLRNFSQDIHCDSACQSMSKDIGVVTDMRFPNEYQYFRNRYQKFHLLYIQSTRAELETSRDAHESEKYLKELAKKATKTLSNNTSIKEFQDSVRKYIEEVR